VPKKLVAFCISAIGAAVSSGSDDLLGVFNRKHLSSSDVRADNFESLLYL